MAESVSTVSLKLLIDKKTRKVVFAEADNLFVDLLFLLMPLPLGTVIKLVNQNSMVGSLGNLYGSIQNISDTYLQPNLNKDVLLNPEIPCHHSFKAPFLVAPGDDSEAKTYYTCNGCQGNRNSPRRYISDDPKSVCPNCKRCISTEVYYVAPPVNAAESSWDESGGFVKGVVTYMVTDDLKVMPHSAISTINALHEYNIEDFGSLEVKDVHLGIVEGLQLLKAALHTESVLTSVFLRKLSSNLPATCLHPSSGNAFCVFLLNVVYLLVQSYCLWKILSSSKLQY